MSESLKVLNDHEVDHWDGDRLKRKGYSLFLTQYLLNKTVEPDPHSPKPFTLALDAPWGQGKSHFIDAWMKDLELSDPPNLVMKFDAWKADYLVDPLIAFMAAFKNCLDESVKRHCPSEDLKQTIKEKVEFAVKQARRALFPAVMQVGAAALKATTGIAAHELFEFTKESPDQPSELLGKIEEGGIDALNEGLDKFFEKALEGQNERTFAIEAFKESIAAALKLLSSEKKVISMPMFVFIDELDRAKPSFSIAMLEGIKHLFDIPGVCFVVSTNMEQLAFSVNAIYGSGFDGRGYLKRMFDAEYTLPPALGESFARLLLENVHYFEDSIVSGMPARQGAQVDSKDELIEAFSWVARAFELDLRSQRKVMDTVWAAAVGIPNDKKIFFLWLSIIAAWRHKSPEGCIEIFNKKNDITTFEKCWQQVVKHDSRIKVMIPKSFNHDERIVMLKEVAWRYFQATFENLEKRSSAEPDINLYDYPDSVLIKIMDELPRTRLMHQQYPPSIGSYFSLVSTAGHFSDRA